MTEPLKGDDDPAVVGLKRGARENRPDLCVEFYGKAQWGPMFVNAQALRIAAENKSYRAFDKMLEIAGEYPFPNSGTDIGFGSDWDKVQEIAKTDKRIARALQRYEGRLDAAYGAEPAESTPSGGWLQRLGFR
jgi:hypothetical protein